MKKIIILLCIFIITFPIACYATNESPENISNAQENIPSVDASGTDSGSISNIVSGDENVSVEWNNMYTGDLVYSDGFDYSLAFDETDNSVVESLKGVVIEASDAYEYNNGYVTSIAQDLKVKITSKSHKDNVYSIRYYLEDDYNTKLPLYEKLKVNDKVYVIGNFEGDELVGEAFIQYYDKTGWIILLVVIFSALIILIGRTKGLKALIGLFITIALVFYLLVPGILKGMSPVLLTIGVSSLTILITFFIVSGIHKKTFAAIAGTIAGVVAAGVIGTLFSNLMLLTGINEHARMLSVSIPEGQAMFDFKGIMLSGLMISALGACMDVGMSIASAISELKAENPDMTIKQLIKSGMNIGKDVMGTMTNTLILAYVGTSLCCILLYTINDFDLVTVLNQEEIIIEVLKSLAGSIGLVCTIPLTAIISGLIIGHDKSSDTKHPIKNKDDEDDDVKIRYFNG